MSKSPKPKPDPDQNQLAARVVQKTVKAHEQPLPADVEAAWAEWSRGVGQVDSRMMALLRAAFEVGVEAATASKRKA